jgi:hypothetical protein
MHPAGFAEGLKRLRNPLEGYTVEISLPLARISGYAKGDTEFCTVLLRARGAELLLYVRRALAAYPGVLEAPKVVLALPETRSQLFTG